MNMRKYLVRPLEKVAHYPAVRERHLHVLNNMLLVNLVQSMERFFKDIASVCVDHLCDRVVDNRFDELSVKGSFLAAHFEDSSAGTALCESDTWLSCRQINDRFKKFLKHPTGVGDPFHIFPPNGDEFRTMNVVWQLRHSLVHNVGVLTRSDAAKLKVLARRHVDSPRMLMPEISDLRYLRSYLDQRAQAVNQRVADRLGLVLSAIHRQNSMLFAPQEEADNLTSKFGVVVTVAGAAGVLPP
ncbi:MAG: hypothetical protein ACQESR_01685 [Planctomycetota bacterium]